MYAKEKEILEVEREVKGRGSHGKEKEKLRSERDGTGRIRVSYM